MSFRLSDRSTAKLDKVDSNLVALVKMAILKTKVDFGVICGLRTIQSYWLIRVCHKLWIANIYLVER